MTWGLYVKKPSAHALRALKAKLHFHRHWGRLSDYAWKLLHMRGRRRADAS